MPIRTVLTSRVFLAKAKVAQPEGAWFLEEVMAEITLVERLGLLIAGLLMPARVIEWLFVDGERNPDNLATVIFSSGSTGMPKGVMLSHRNVLANVESLARVYRVTGDDRLMGILPLFHSFGFTGTIWLPLVEGFGVVYHPNPLDAATIGAWSRNTEPRCSSAHPASAWGTRASAAPSSSRRCAMPSSGPRSCASQSPGCSRKKYGLDLLEAYGCTEMSPGVAVNAPDNPATGQKGWKPGIVIPLPGVAARVVDRGKRDGRSPQAPRDSSWSRATI